MSDFINQLSLTLGAYLPNLLAAIGILILGWLVALALAAIIRGLLNRTSLDDRLAAMVRGDETTDPEAINVENWISTVVFWLVMLFTIGAFLQTLNLTGVSQPINQLVGDLLAFIPAILIALALLFVAWLIATFLRMIVVRVLSASGIARRLSDDADMKAQDRVSLGQTIGNVVYWLVFLLFLPAILDVLNLQGILLPVQRVVDEILGVLPNLFGAAVILAVGWLAARIIRRIVTNLLVGVGVDRFGQDTDVSGALGQQRLSEVLGTLVYVLVLIPVIIAAVNALGIEAISEPATDMLNTLLNALPALLGAFLLIGVAYFISRWVGRFVEEVLESVGFNRLFVWLGLYDETSFEQPAVAPEEETAGIEALEYTPSELVGYLTTIAIMLFAIVEAANLLGFEILAVLISQFIVAAGQVLLGLVIFGLGLYLASIAERVVRSAAGAQANILAPAARVAIIVFSGALALREMGIAEDIVNLAFGLVLGAFAVAVALAFGLGGRDIAARQLEDWRRSLETRGPESPTTPPRQQPPAEGPGAD